MSHDHHLKYKEGVKLYLSGDHHRLNLLLKSTLLTQQEKSLLRFRKINKSGKHIEAYNILKNINHSESIFLEAEKNVLLAVSYGHQSKWQLSYFHNQKAYLNYKILNEKRGVFVSLYNMSVDTSRLGLETLSRNHLEEAENIAHDSYDQLMIWRALACSYSKSEEYSKAVETIDRAISKEYLLNEMDRLSLNIIAVDIYFRSDISEKSWKLLEKLNETRLPKERPRISFEYRIMKALRSNEPLSNIPQSVQASYEYTTKWEVIKNLQQGDQLNAKKYWKKLQELFPEIYDNDFEIKNKSDQKSLFATYLKKQFIKPTPLPIDSCPRDSKLSQLLELLVTSQTPQRKEDLIEKIWKTSYHPSFDNRFYKLIERLKKEFNLNIINQSRTYLIK